MIDFFFNSPGTYTLETIALICMGLYPDSYFSLVIFFLNNSNAAQIENILTFPLLNTTPITYMQAGGPLLF